jgi:hypothetical protein
LREKTTRPLWPPGVEKLISAIDLSRLDVRSREQSGQRKRTSSFFFNRNDSGTMT